VRIVDVMKDKPLGIKSSPIKIVNNKITRLP